MTKYLLTALVVGLLLATNAAGTDKEDEVKKDLEKLQGQWLCVRVEVEEKAEYGELAQVVALEFNKDTCTVTMVLMATKGTFTINPSKEPKTFDLTMTDGKKLAGIYKIDDDGLRLCACDPSKEMRPQDFATVKGADIRLLTFKNDRQLKDYLAKSKEEKAKDAEREDNRSEENRKKLVAARKVEEEARKAEEDKKWEEGKKRDEEKYRRMKEQPRKDAENLQGAWRPVRSEQGALDDTWEVEGQRVAFEKDAFTLMKGDKILLKGTFKLDITKYPKTIDIAITEGGHKGEVMLGIWEMGEDGLRWCVAEPSKDRPKGFATDKGGTDRLARFQKEKP